MGTTTAAAPGRERLPVLALLCANGVSLLGTQVSVLAIPWFVLQTTGSAAQTGLAGFFGLLPILLGGVFGGPLVDRLGFRRASIVADLGSGLCVALVPFLHATVGLAFWQLLALVFLRGLIGTPGNTARQGLLPDLIARSGLVRERVNAAFQAIFNGASLLGAPLAGTLIVALGPATVLWLDAASYAASALIVALAVPRPVAAVAAPASDGDRLDLREAFRFLGRDRVILSMVSVGTLVNFFGAPLGGVIMPVYAARVLGGPVDLGVLMASGGAGGIIGTLLFGAIGHRVPRRGLFVGAFLVSALPLWVLVALPPLLPAALATGAQNLCFAPLSALLMTLLQERVPAQLRGRVFGLLTALILAAAPLGMLVAGVTLDALGLRATLLALACAFLAVVIANALNPALRGMEASRPPAGDDPHRPGAPAGATPA